MFGFGGGGSGNGPIDRMRAHPFQGLLGMLAGAVVPGGGLAAQMGFNRYNNAQFNNATQANQARVTDQMHMDTNAAMNRPLNGALGAFDGQNYGQGGGGMMQPGVYGGGYQNPGAYGFGAPGMDFSQFNSPGIGGLLDFLGPGQSPPQTLPTVNAQGPGMTHSSPQARRDGYGFGDMRGSGLYGISNFNVGGSPVINGTNGGLMGGGDMNGLAMMHRTPGY